MLSDKDYNLETNYIFVYSFIYNKEIYIYEGLLTIFYYRFSIYSFSIRLISIVLLEKFSNTQRFI